jgi:hypothetical protein
MGLVYWALGATVEVVPLFVVEPDPAGSIVAPR